MAERPVFSRISSASGSCRNRAGLGRRQGLDLDYASLTAEANKAEPFRSLINPNAARFAKPGDMPATYRGLLP